MSEGEWTITFVAPDEDGVLQDHEVAGVSEKTARSFYQHWWEEALAPTGSIAIFCGTCPVGQNIDCPHAGQPGVPGWPYADIKKVRIDPTARLA